MHREIWILDDDIELCQLVCRRLQQWGWVSKPVYEPSNLLSLIQDKEPDLLIIDQLLPNRKGSEIIEDIKARDYRFPILMLSALGTVPAERITGLESGADDYLSKPFTFRELQLRIEKLLARIPREKFAYSTQLADGEDRYGQQPRLPQSNYLIGSSLLDSKHFLLQGSHASVELSRGDTALLHIFCLNPGITLTRKQLATGCGSLIDVSQSRSIDVRISRLRKAFQAVSHEDSAIEAVRGQGYRLTLCVQTA